MTPKHPSDSPTASSPEEEIEETSWKKGCPKKKKQKKKPPDTHKKPTSKKPSTSLIHRLRNLGQISIGTPALLQMLHTCLKEALPSTSKAFRLVPATADLAAARQVCIYGGLRLLIFLGSEALLRVELESPSESEPDSYDEEQGLVWLFQKKKQLENQTSA